MERFVYLNPEQDTESLLSKMEELLYYPKVALDIETYDPNRPGGQKGLCPYEGKIRVVQLACEAFSLAFVEPSRNGNCDLPLFSLSATGFLENAEVISALKELLEDSSITKLLHNAKFDLGYLKAQFNLDAVNIWDTRLGSQIIYSGLGVRHSLKDTVKRELGILVDKEEQRSDWGALQLTESQVNYALKDVEVLFDLQAAQEKKMEEWGCRSQFEFERSFTPDLVKLNNTGFYLDEVKLKEYIKTFTDLKTKYSDKVSEALAPYAPDTLDKPKENKNPSTLFDDTPYLNQGQKLKWMADLLGESALEEQKKELTGSSQSAVLIGCLKRKYPGIDLRDDKGKESLGKDVCLAIIDDYPVLKDLVCYKTVDKLLQYANGLKAGQFMVRGELRSLGVFSELASNAVGRMSCSRFYTKCGSNFQNPNKPFANSGSVAQELQRLYDLPDLKELTIAAPGKKLIISDFAAAHARIAADLSLDSFLVQVYENDFDSHSKMVAGLTEILGIDQMARDLRGRRIAKGLPITKEEYKQYNYKGEFEETSAIRSDKAHPLSELINNIRNKVAKNVFYLGLNIGGVGRLVLLLATAGFEASEEAAKRVLEIYRDTYKGLVEYIDANFKVLEQAEDQLINDVICKRMDIPRVNCHRWVPYKIPPPDDLDKRGNPKRPYIKINDVVPSNWLIIEGRALKTAKMFLNGRVFPLNPHWEAKIVVTVHDEVLVEVKEEYAYVCAIAVSYAMKVGLQQYLDIVEAVPVEDPAKMIADQWSEK